MTVDWLRVAEPQPDGYDSKVTLEYLARVSKYSNRRAVPPGQPLVWPDGKAVFVRMEHHTRPSTELSDLEPENPLVQQGLALVETWPAVALQCRQLTLALSALTRGHPQTARGCTCGNYGDEWGWVYTTADNPQGFAEGLVHEQGHWKLRAFGVWFEEWTDFLLLNTPDQLYASPVRKDTSGPWAAGRPMGAVLHAQYSYVHVAEMCVRMLLANPAPDGGDYAWTELQLKRIAEGQATLRAHAKGTPGVGDLFLQGLDTWTTRVLDEGRTAVAKGVVA